MTSEPSQEIADLQLSVKVLAERVNRLERALPDISVENLRGTGATPALRAPRPTSAPAPSIYGPPNLAPRPEVPRPATPSPPSPPTPPFDWGKLAEQLFAARTLAWAGGVATVLGIVLLFVMAASRGWITPADAGRHRCCSSRSASFGAALELDRRAWRSDAILAAAGVGDRRAVREPVGGDIALPPRQPRGRRAARCGDRRARRRAWRCASSRSRWPLFGMSAAMLAPTPREQAT